MDRIQTIGRIRMNPPTHPGLHDAPFLGALPRPLRGRRRRTGGGLAADWRLTGGGLGPIQPPGPAHVGLPAIDSLPELGRALRSRPRPEVPVRLRPGQVQPAPHDFYVERHCVKHSPPRSPVESVSFAACRNLAYSECAKHSPNARPAISALLFLGSISCTGAICRYPLRWGG